MTIFRSLVVRVLCCVALPIVTAWGQQVSSPTLDFAVQGWTGKSDGRLFSEDGGIAGEAAVSWQARAVPRGAVIVGAGVAVQRVFDFADRCRVPAPPTPFTGCAPHYPGFTSLAALAGLEGRFGFTARVVGGPGIFRATSGGTAVGLQGRADFATPSLVHIALVASARGAYIPMLRGHAYRTRALGFGLRFR